MKATILGISDRRSGTAKKTGKPYDGTIIHCVLARSKDVETGQAVKEVYLNHLSRIAIPALNVGDFIDVEYSDQGFIEGIEVLKPAKA